MSGNGTFEQSPRGHRRKPLQQIKKKFQRDKNTNHGFTFACLIDGSDKSIKTVALAADLANSQNDKIYAITVDEKGPFEVFREPTREKVQSEATRLNVNVENVFLEEQGDPVETLKTYLNETLDVDFVLVKLF